MARAVPVFGGTRRRRQDAGPVGPRPSLVDAFAPSFILPEPLRTKKAISAMQQTVSAVESVATKKRISTAEAASQLMTAAQQIKKRDEILASGQDRLHTLAALKEAGIPSALLKKTTTKFVTPRGISVTTSLPGGNASKTLLKPFPVTPKRRPTPAATPTRKTY